MVQHHVFLYYYRVLIFLLHKELNFFMLTTHFEIPDQIVEDICKGDEDLKKKLRILMLEVEVMRQDGRHAPDHIRSDQWARLLELQSKSQRTNYLRYLFKTEKAKENFKVLHKQYYSR